MRLKNLAKIQFVISWILFLIALPFILISLISKCINYPFVQVSEYLTELSLKIGNKLLRMSDEVKDGTIKNDYCIRNYTAIFAMKKLKRSANLK